ncbi:hypothetical protein KFK09_016100 [Dendrobium nobile]|uniref:Uncharacterized protein n=1 Tax=Dendrobium nobile TaxID=94219 RepID=A0A8T3AYE3_DENNO|nr:hypothetical protein KFK09_016100 [Dendrobium nobile]
MASSSSPPSNGKLNYYYLLFSFTLVFIVLTIITIAMGCCAWFQHRFSSVRHLLNRKHNSLEIQHWISTFKYHKKEAEVEGGGRGNCTRVHDFSITI